MIVCVRFGNVIELDGDLYFVVVRHIIKQTKLQNRHTLLSLINVLLAIENYVVKNPLLDQ
jgi:hypothetical protein